MNSHSNFLISELQQQKELLQISRLPEIGRMTELASVAAEFDRMEIPKREELASLRRCQELLPLRGLPIHRTLTG